MRRVIGSMLLAACALAQAAPQRGLPHAEPIVFAFDSLHGIAAWLRSNGREGYVGADVADAMGIARGEDEQVLPAWQRGFRSHEVLRIAQILTDESATSSFSWCNSPTTRFTSTFRRRSAACTRPSSPSRARTWCCRSSEPRRNCASAKRSFTGRTGANPANGSRAHQPDRLPAQRPAGEVGRAAEVSLTSKASKEGCPKSKRS